MLERHHGKCLFQVPFFEIFPIINCLLILYVYVADPTTLWKYNTKQLEFQFTDTYTIQI